MSATAGAHICMSSEVCKLCIDRPRLKKLFCWCNNKIKKIWRSLQLSQWVVICIHIHTKIDKSNEHSFLKYLELIGKVRIMQFGYCTYCSYLHSENSVTNDFYNGPKLSKFLISKKWTVEVAGQYSKMNAALLRLIPVISRGLSRFIQYTTQSYHNTIIVHHSCL